MENHNVNFLTFFIMWANYMRWEVPPLHVRICIWLDTCKDRERVLMVFRGAAKSTIYAVWCAYRLYRNRAHRALVWSADNPTAGMLTADAINVLRNHPLCRGMLPTKPGAKRFFVIGSTDARNPSMRASGVDSNVTGARADDIDFDDVEVPGNIESPEARAKLRNRISESTHIAVPGAQQTLIGTPHTHDSIYPERIAAGAAHLKICLFESVKRYEDTSKLTRYRFDFTPAEDGIYVMLGIGAGAKMCVEGEDYVVEGDEIVFAKPPLATLDICAHCSWPKRFTRAEIHERRRMTPTLNAWDSQYQLEAKPLKESKLDPHKLRAYDAMPRTVKANGAVRMMLGKAQIVSGRAVWDPSLGKLKSDGSAFSLILDDAQGNYYWQCAEAFTGEYAEFSDAVNSKIIGGQVMQAVELIKKYNIVHIYVETNGVGAFTEKLLQRAIKQERLICGVTAITATANKNKRILDGLEGPMKSGVLWAHTSVINGPAWDQMMVWNPEVANQPDDYLNSAADAILQAPVRINHLVEISTVSSGNDWRQSTGVFEVTLET
jgi:hypothetical protein